MLPGMRADYAALRVDGSTFLTIGSGAVKVIGVEQVQFGDTTLDFANAFDGAITFDGLRYIASSHDLAAANGADAGDGITQPRRTGQTGADQFGSFRPSPNARSFSRQRWCRGPRDQGADLGRERVQRERLGYHRHSRAQKA